MNASPLLSSGQWLWLGLFTCVLALAVAVLPSLIHRRTPKRPAGPGKLPYKGFPFRVYSKSVIGSREYQQDYVRLPLGISAGLFAKRGLLCVVCDGMGGMEGGELASRICADTLMNAYYADTAAVPEAFFREKVAQADRQIAALRDSKGQALHSGTTLVGVILRDNTICCASAGDSRIYLYRGKNLIKLTRDHNYLLQLMQKVDAGAMELDAAMADPQREALISYVGKGHVDILDVKSLPAMPGDILLLCSDGLTKALPDDELVRILEAHAAKPYLLPGSLIREALRKKWMSHDNISVAVVCTDPCAAM